MRINVNNNTVLCVLLIGFFGWMISMIRHS